ncbi:MAG: hypothetical protein HZA89_10390 [Verrucomicrobia bacterium]|nr:hypothetical protein [Verrucomicrobiota bacterium]
MSTVAEIESAIEQLPPQDKARLRARLVETLPAAAPILEQLRGLAGAGQNLPSDLAANHDHYLHGTAKRSTP